MSRLTEKGKYSEPYESKSATECINKLGKLEDLEEQLKCPLEVIYKAITSGVYTNYFREFDKEQVDYIDNVYFGINPFGEFSLMFGYKKEEILQFSDYKKTWWLKENREE